MSKRELLIEGARQNNLKNISLRLPHNRLIAVTGLSGSGKSSLAFDTIFAEGQWRFIESLSTYARVFIEKLNRPDVDRVLNIRPAIALQQHNPVKGSRSTVGTLTEIYDLLRSVYANIATPHCHMCGRELIKWDISSITQHLLDRYANRRAVILFETNESPEAIVMKGFERLWIDGKICNLLEQQSNSLDIVSNSCSNRLVVTDRLVIKDDERLYDSLRIAWSEGKQRVKVLIFPEGGDSEGSPQQLVFSSGLTCDYCNVSVSEPSALLFSFNHPIGACKRCKGFGNILIYDEGAIVQDKGLSLSEGALGLLQKDSLFWWREQLLRGAEKSGIDIHRPYGELSKHDRETLFMGNEHFYGINDLFEELENKRYKLHVRVFLSRYRTPERCPQCGGKRLCSDALAYKIEGQDIADLCNKSIDSLLEWFDQLHLGPMQEEAIKEALRQIRLKLRFLKRVGLGYLTLSRQAKTLSGGEYQRLNLANQLSAQLTGTLYVLDEPTIGLHPRDTDRVITILQELVSLGNTVIVVEHDREVIASADYVVEMGPKGGASGGEVVFSGSYEDFVHSDTLTAKAMQEDMALYIPEKRGYTVSANHSIHIKGARGNNLKSIDVQIPLERLTVVTGVSGSGKSSLIVETLYAALANYFKTDRLQPLPYDSITGLSNLRDVRLIDQSPIGKTPRSNPATYLKVFDLIRKIYSQQPEAKAHRYSPGYFSFNIKGGRCEACKGEGFQRVEMYFFEDLYIKCEHCGGSRYNKEALKVLYKGKNISQVLDMTFSEAAEFFGDHPELIGRLRLIEEIGLGYLKLGQPANTLSGGEAQRLKICSELIDHQGMTPKGHKGVLYIMDEPTVGLHFYDVVNLLRIIFRLLKDRNTVVLIEHNPDVIMQADHIIDLGPEGGHLGGNLVFQGSPEEIIASSKSITGRYLKQYRQDKWT
jgi:excinuclease ABC subunit A